MKRINVVVIHKSEQLCQQIKLILLEFSSIKRVETFTRLQDGLTKVTANETDVVLLDVNLPKQDEKMSIEIILQHRSIPIIVIAENNVFQTAKTVQAMNNGAIDYIKFERTCKYSVIEKETEMITKIVAAKSGRVNQLKKISKLTTTLQRKKDELETNKLGVFREPIIVIGSSTGGPRALQKILSNIPKNFFAPIFIVQHMPEGFTKSLAKRLNNYSDICVKEAVQGEIVKRGTAYIAPGNYHMKVLEHGGDLTIQITEEEERLGHRPSVNHLFESVATLKNTYKIAVVLTGMGRDGAEGAKKIKELQSEAVIIAESKETAIINGMPNAVIQTNCVTEILHLDDIAQALIDYTNKWGN